MAVRIFWCFLKSIFSFQEFSIKEGNDNNMKPFNKKIDTKEFCKLIRSCKTVHRFYYFYLCRGGWNYWNHLWKRKRCGLFTIKLAVVRPGSLQIGGGAVGSLFNWWWRDLVLHTMATVRPSSRYFTGGAPGFLIHWQRRSWLLVKLALPWPGSS